MRQWLDILDRAVTSGERGPDRTGVGTLSLFGEQLEFDNSGPFPAVTAKALAFGQVKAEMSCFIRGRTDLDDFHAVDCRIWDYNGLHAGWVDGGARWPGDLGRIYGAQWRHWHGTQRLGGMLGEVVVDQLRLLVDGLRSDPHSRRHVVTAWQPAELGQMCLPPCPMLFQARVSPATGCLDMRVDCRSTDLFLGLPFDVAGYALLQRLIAREVSRAPGKLVFQLGDAHLYLNHVDAAVEVLRREPFAPPGLSINPRLESMFDFMPGDAALLAYRSHSAVRAELNV